ncbi:MAG TPA: hypothetical protein VGO63_00195 [Candidatus Paceibacterota bacterium]|nr:hypothetical protein [Candidatus Paceibacterota bacterium]
MRKTITWLGFLLLCIAVPITSSAQAYFTLSGKGEKQEEAKKKILAEIQFLGQNPLANDAAQRRENLYQFVRSSKDVDVKVCTGMLKLNPKNRLEQVVSRSQLFGMLYAQITTNELRPMKPHFYVWYLGVKSAVASYKAIQAQTSGFTIADLEELTALDDRDEAMGLNLYHISYFHSTDLGKEIKKRLETKCGINSYYL